MGEPLQVKSIAVLGAGKSGLGAAMLAKKAGLDVFLSEHASIPSHTVDMLLQAGVRFEQQGHSLADILAMDMVVKSPGIPESSLIMKRLRAAGKPVVSEIEWAFHFNRGRIIAITGSNGKSTTTMMVYHILKNSGLNVEVAGNIGRSWAEMLCSHSPDFWVLEVSSFQLDDVYHFRPDAGIVLNVTPDHLDRYHNNFEEYLNAKMAMADGMNEDDTLIYNADDFAVSGYISTHRLDCRLIPVSMPHQSQKKITFDHPEGGTMILDTLKVRGLHNFFNAACAVQGAVCMGVSPQRAIQNIQSFEPIAHRLEPVRTVDGVEFVNDSKATNVDAVQFALQAMIKPVIWIAGGLDKGNDYSPVLPVVMSKVKAIVTLGLENSKLHDAFGGRGISIIDTFTMDDAVDAAYFLAEQGDVVLLSPACASFDLFENFEDRGDRFRDAVSSLLEKEETADPL